MMASNLKVISLLAILWQWILLENSSIAAAEYRKAGAPAICRKYQGQCLEKVQSQNMLEKFFWHMRCKLSQEKILKGNVIIQKTIQIL